MTAWEVKFSEAMSSMPRHCLPFSFSMREKISSSTAFKGVLPHSATLEEVMARNARHTHTYTHTHLSFLFKFQCRAFALLLSFIRMAPPPFALKLFVGKLESSSMPKVKETLHLPFRETLHIVVDAPFPLACKPIVLH